MTSSDDVSSLVSWRPEIFPLGRRQTAVRCVVGHVTGVATYKHAEKLRLPPLIHLGRNNFLLRGTTRRAHYAVDPWGQIGCYAPEGQRPMAQGWASYKTRLGGRTGREGVQRGLAGGELTIPAWWRQAWPQLSSPLDLLPPGADSPNYAAVAIEFILHDNCYNLTWAQYASGFMLIADICKRHKIPWGPERVFGHEDVDPWGRGDAVGGWDPGVHRNPPRASWDRLFGRVPTEPTAPVLSTPDRPPWAELL